MAPMEHLTAEGPWFDGRSSFRSLRVAFFGAADEDGGG